MTMRLRPYVLLLSAALSTLSASAQYATGLTFNDDEYEQTSRISPALKFSSVDLPAYSLKAYSPTPGNQGNIGSCVGWATGYGALTIAEAFQAKNTTRSAITERARSAMYIYLQIADRCPDGSMISDALKLAQTQGVPPFSAFGSVSCGTTIPSTLRQLAAQFKIKDYYTLFSIGAANDLKISSTRTSISAGKPVVIGMTVTTSFNSVGSAGVYKPYVGEPSIGGHAMTVIGYDDMSRTFEILNSWGTSWGNAGFFRMSYDDYARLVKYGYQFTLEGAAPPSPSGKEVSLTGSFRFRKLTGFDAQTNAYNFADAPVTFDVSYYSVSNIRLNDFFRIQAADVTKDRYVYIFSIKPDNSAELLFPTSKTIDAVTVKDIPVVPADNATIEIPADPKKAMSTDKPGNDMLCILYSSELINDIDAVVAKVKNGTGDWMPRLQAALGNRLIPASDIRYNSSVMGLNTKSRSGGSIAPIILKVTVN
jgi:hypothetical protein